MKDWGGVLVNLLNCYNMKVLKLLFFYIFSLALSIQFFDWGVYLLDQHSPLINLLGLLYTIDVFPHDAIIYI